MLFLVEYNLSGGAKELAFEVNGTVSHPDSVRELALAVQIANLLEARSVEDISIDAEDDPRGEGGNIYIDLAISSEDKFERVRWTFCNGAWECFVDYDNGGPDDCTELGEQSSPESVADYIAADYHRRVAEYDD